MASRNYSSRAVWYNDDEWVGGWEVWHSSVDT